MRGSNPTQCHPWKCFQSDGCPNATGTPLKNKRWCMPLCTIACVFLLGYWLLFACIELRTYVLEAGGVFDLVGALTPAEHHYSFNSNLYPWCIRACAFVCVCVCACAHVRGSHRGAGDFGWMGSLIPPKHNNQANDDVYSPMHKSMCELWTISTIIVLNLYMWRLTAFGTNATLIPLQHH